MGRVIYFIIPFLLLCNLIQEYLTIDNDLQWRVYFVSEKLATVLILISSLGIITKKRENIYKLTLFMYSFELFNEVIGENIKGVLLSEIYFYLLFCSCLYLVRFYLKYGWIKN